MKNMNEQRRRKHWIAVAICLAYIVLMYATLPTSPTPSKKTSKIEQSASPEQSSPESFVLNQHTETEQTAASDASAIEIDMDNIHVNGLAAARDMGRKYPVPAECVYVVWEEADIISYYGNNLVPPYLPAGLTASPRNAVQNVVLSMAGDVWEDTVRLDFYQDYHADGSAKSADNLYIPKGFYLNASKIGLLYDFSCINSGNAVSISYLNETTVSIGGAMLEHGPYDPDTHEPSGHYEQYVAQFTLNGIDYEIVTSRLELEEAVRIVASIIYNESNININNS